MDYVRHYLTDIRKASGNTISAYRTALNHYIGYLEKQKQYNRKDITFKEFNRRNVKEYMNWMLNDQLLAPKTCNLRLTAVHSLMEYASQESFELTAYYLEVCSVKAVKTPRKPIEYFERTEMTALMSAPDTRKKSERRNQMILIFLYDTATRVSEMLDVTIRDIHMNIEPSYVTICGKGRKYRNLPLMPKTKKHLKCYLHEFHEDTKPDAPLFYATTHGEKHHLSMDTVEKMLKRYAVKCISNGTKMPSNVYCHMIRKTRAMDLYQQGIPLTHIQQLLGHENISTTSGFYAFATLDTLAKSLEKANESQTDKKWKDKKVMQKLYCL
ncbi:hypothetical protein E4K67_18065 [Desulfosporosinus fructosivorans]|uniref:Integrase n=2 Tax=Desulfosporosinus fructosivorans TaxID=2018669 RepID=A0A4Z0R220_9FIRM|nr:hypothetical protein E4K67_18065 [Desulfosporosinus fructosivorans]